ncbi:MAG TPA: PSD1 and planctomycete cytochrome C domain-containing protein [Bryobacteraceae bacterium]|jgi:cytochrome c553|nr:PSD1 and planctomycete cytochrome C domain-containing protein [Bryobacteraceae bacterium]
MRFAAVGIALLGSAIQPLFGQAPKTAAGTPEFFETKVRPVLANNCFGCHTNSALGGLRLDSLDAMKKGGKRGTALVPGDPDKSLLITAIRQTDAALKMPAGGKLKDSEIADLTAWVKAGALWPKSDVISSAAPNPSGKYTISPERRAFWSFQPLAKTAVPPVKDAKWAKNDIDRFVLAKLEKEGLKPVGPATKVDLLRRATLDLTGLPPTPEEVEAFEKDASPEAFAKVVDRLLASPQYGERWGRMWLDVARYGEDDYRSLNPNPRGYRPYPNAWAYRDWVIQAFNDDIPYDQFVKAQLAGDLQDEKTRYKTLPATGFLGLGPWYYDNGSNEVTRADERHDRVDAVTRGFLGLTVACARCHDHKYDPIPQTDYYALAGVFFNTTYEEYPRAPKKVIQEFIKREDDIDEKQKMAQEMSQDASKELSRTLALQTSNYLQGVWEVSGPQKKEMAAVVEARKLDYELFDRWVKYMAKPTDKYKYKEAWQALIKKGGTAPEAKKLAEKFQQDLEDVMLAKNDLDAQNKVLEDKDIEGTKPKKRTDKPSNFVSNKDFNPGALIRFKTLPDDVTNFWVEIFQRELKDNEDPMDMMPGRMGTPGVLLFRGWGLESRLGPETQARLKSIQDDIAEAKKKLDPYYPFIHGVKDSDHPVNIQLALRGNPETLGPEVPRHFLSVLSPGDPIPLTEGSGRAQLADLIVKQPIAMRVIVNRIWKEHFGTGIVDTPSNFGFGGERPTDPELLEYLAQTFVNDGMSIKKLQRRIMLSSTYQLGTEYDKVSFDKDSGNRFYWRANRKRMDAEQIRDSILEVSGNLDNQIGGPSKDLTPDFTRRTVYGKVSRYKLDAYLQLFDFPAPNISAEKRFTTTVPLQRLFLMNSDFVQVEAEGLAKRVAAEPDNKARIRKMYMLVYGRRPTEKEIQIGIDYLHTEPMKEYEENKNKPKPDAAKGRKGAGSAGAAEGSPAKEPASETPSAPPVSGLAKPEPGTTDIAAVAAGPAKPPAAAPADAAAPDAGADTPALTEGGADANPDMGMGMMAGMAGMGRRGQGPPKPVEIKYEPSAWGRYAKILLSSTEFTFIN